MCSKVTYSFISSLMHPLIMLFFSFIILTITGIMLRTSHGYIMYTLHVYIGNAEMNILHKKKSYTLSRKKGFKGLILHGHVGHDLTRKRYDNFSLSYLRYGQCCFPIHYYGECRQHHLTLPGSPVSKSSDVDTSFFFTHIHAFFAHAHAYSCTRTLVCVYVYVCVRVHMCSY